MRAFAVAFLVFAVSQCSGDPAPVPSFADPSTTAVTVEVPVTDPPFIADASGVPQLVTAPVDVTPVVALAEVPAITVPAVVPGPGGSAIPGRCTQYEDRLAALAPPGGWSIERMSAYMWRESRCTPTVRSRTSDSGALQINDVNLKYLRGALAEPVDRYTLLDVDQNIRAAAALCVYWQRAHRSCYRPWGGR